MEKCLAPDNMYTYSIRLRLCLCVCVCTHVYWSFTLSPAAADLPEAGAFTQAVEALLFDQLHDFRLDLLPQLPAQRTHTRSTNSGVYQKKGNKNTRNLSPFPKGIFQYADLRQELHIKRTRSTCVQAPLTEVCILPGMHKAAIKQNYAWLGGEW